MSYIVAMKSKVKMSIAIVVLSINFITKLRFPKSESAAVVQINTI